MERNQGWEPVEGPPELVSRPVCLKSKNPHPPPGMGVNSRAPGMGADPVVKLHCRRAAPVCWVPNREAESGGSHGPMNRNTI